MNADRYTRLDGGVSIRHQWCPLEKKKRADSNTVNGMLKARHPQAGVKQTGDRSPEITAAPLVPLFIQPENRYSDSRRTAKAAGRFWRGQHLWCCINSSRLYRVAIQPGAEKALGL
ncbi:hypothetical protein [Mucilaginibacter gilvus]|uniref:Uncharacterized protein n=1 Tax=Mucilaginibacter gilvus TaxID=2305909 RepID=A0A444MS13_9SPHI|nr:hypothetical protein [Mucilaginibacter gilvus]RWY55406.1 hypothetical protein EPL05_03260 [Mucilaginibacter gilvus]